MKALVFVVEGEYARFRCSHTTTSALTYLAIHPIAVKGLIGAVMGIGYSELYEYTKNMKVAIEVLNPINKDTQSFNLVPQSGGNGAANFQSRIEFLRDVKYRIFVNDEEEKLKAIKKVLQNKSYIFTPYLGASEHAAKINCEDIYDIENLTQNAENEYIKVQSIIPKDMVYIKEDDEITLCIDRIPVKNSKTREYIKYEKVAFNTNGDLKASSQDIKKVGSYNVYLF